MKDHLELYQRARKYYQKQGDERLAQFMDAGVAAMEQKIAPGAPPIDPVDLDRTLGDLSSRRITPIAREAQE